MAKTLSNTADRAAVLERLSRLEPGSGRQWGRMTSHQAVCHLSDSFKAALGEKDVSPAGNLFFRTAGKWFALKVPMRWPKGVPTRPEMDQDAGGTRPVEFARDVGELATIVEQFARPANGWGKHPLFGDMTDEEWQRWGYLHMDHHLRQFGV